MKPLILTGLHGVQLKDFGLADLIVPFCFKFAWGQLPSPEELAAYLGPRLSEHERADHWSCYIVGRWPPSQKDRQHLSLVEFCQPYELVELWFDPNPVDQLQLIWLLDGLRSDPVTAAKLKLRLVGYEMLTATPQQFAKWHAPAHPVTSAYLDAASDTWQAYRASTPEAFFGLLRSDLSRFLMLRPVLIDLLEELPSAATGLGATEMRLLELVACGYSRTNALFHLRSLRQRRVFDSGGTGLLARRARARADAGDRGPRRGNTGDPAGEALRPGRCL